MPESSTPTNGEKRRSWADRLRDRLRTPKQPEDPPSRRDEDWMDPWATPKLNDGHRAQTRAQPMPALQGSLFIAANFVYDYRQKYHLSPAGTQIVHRSSATRHPLSHSRSNQFATTRPLQQRTAVRPSLSTSASFHHHPGYVVQRHPSNDVPNKCSYETVASKYRDQPKTEMAVEEVTKINVESESKRTAQQDIELLNHPETTVVIDRPGLVVSGQRVCIFTGHDTAGQTDQTTATKVVLRVVGDESHFQRNSQLRRSLSDRANPNRGKPHLFQDTTRLQNLSRSRGSLHNLFTNASDDDEATKDTKITKAPPPSRGQLTRPSHPPPPPPVHLSKSPEVPSAPPRRVFRHSRTEPGKTPPGRPLSANMISWSAWAGLETKPTLSETLREPSCGDKNTSLVISDPEPTSMSDPDEKEAPSLERSDRKRRPVSRLWPSFSSATRRLTESSSPAADSHPESTKVEVVAPQEHIYEEIDDLNNTSESRFSRVGRGSFAGASRCDILRYIEDVRKKNELNCNDLPSPGGVTSLTPGLPQVPGDDYEDEDMANMGALLSAMRHNAPNRNSNRSNASSQTSQESIISTSAQLAGSSLRSRVGSEIERNDSGVGSETSGTTRLRHRLRRGCQDHLLSTSQYQPWCVDCDQCIEEDDSTVIKEEEIVDSLLCHRCVRRRTERREVLAELLETEVRYARDLRVLQDELYKPLLVAGLVPVKHLDAVFLNVAELSSHSQKLSHRLRESVEIALEQGDDDLLTVDVGKLFLSDETEELLNALHRYCVKSGEASLLLSSLEKERELLRIFLKASQLENPALRRMDLHAFLMVPVQRITKYPLLLGRLLRATATVDVEARDTLRQAQAKVESFLATINAEATQLGSFPRPWRRTPIGLGPNCSPTRNYEDIMALRLRKMALESLDWSENSHIALEGMVKVTQPNELLMTATRNKGRGLRWTNVWAVLAVLNAEGKQELRLNTNELDTSRLIFPVRPFAQEAALVLFKDVKTARPGPSLFKEPLLLSQCTVTSEAELPNFFEIHQILSKESLIFQMVDTSQTNQWLVNIKVLSLGLGRWKQRRNALSHVMMIN